MISNKIKNELEIFKNFSKDQKIFSERIGRPYSDFNDFEIARKTSDNIMTFFTTSCFSSNDKNDFISDDTMEYYCINPKSLKDFHFREYEILSLLSKEYVACKIWKSKAEKILRIQPSKPMFSIA